MAVNLSNLQPPRGSRHRKVRVGRGMGSKLGKTCGKGNKGQKSRKGYSRRPGFEGGQMPLHRRIPKRGFRNPFGRDFAIVNVEMLNAFAAGETVTPETLVSRGLVSGGRRSVKILGDGGPALRGAGMVALVAVAGDSLEEHLELEEGLFLALPRQRQKPRVARRGLVAPQAARVAQEVRVDIALGGQANHRGREDT